MSDAEILQKWLGMIRAEFGDLPALEAYRNMSLVVVQIAAFAHGLDHGAAKEITTQVIEHLSTILKIEEGH